jgi:hypothetical protein
MRLGNLWNYNHVNFFRLIAYMVAYSILFQ